MFAGSEAGAGIAADIDLGAATREARFKRAPISDRALARAIRAGGETRAGAFIARRRQFTLRLRPPGCTPTVRKRIRRDRARMHRSLPHRPSAPVIPAAARMAARPVAESSAGLSAHACRPCSSGAIFGSPIVANARALRRSAPQTFPCVPGSPLFACRFPWLAWPRSCAAARRPSCVDARRTLRGGAPFRSDSRRLKARGAARPGGLPHARPYALPRSRAPALPRSRAHVLARSPGGRAIPSSSCRRLGRGDTMGSSRQAASRTINRIRLLSEGRHVISPDR
ncbi:hypothetical protein X979_2723 [Burkholderia pseudomallei MSHR7527]|nr:hypothetical protein X979_2723 [Burkholderia pseudomallei MSHR7527]